MAYEEGWVNIGEVAAHLSVGKDSIYRWIDTKGFPARRVGRLLRFRLSEVDEWVERGGGSDPESSSVVHSCGTSIPAGQRKPGLADQGDIRERWDA